MFFLDERGVLYVCVLLFGGERGCIICVCFAFGVCAVYCMCVLCFGCVHMIFFANILGVC